MAARRRLNLSSPPWTKFSPVGAADLYLSAGLAARALAPARVALLGGYAMTAYGSNRLTGDVDLVVEAGASVPAAVRAEGRRALTFGGFQLVVRDVKVDVVERDDEWADLYDAAVRAARRRRGYPVAVVTPPYLVAMKMIAGREKDQADVAYLLGYVLTSAVARRKARKVVCRHLGAYSGVEFDRLAEEADWLRKSGRI